MLVLKNPFLALLALSSAQAGEIPQYTDADKLASLVDTTLSCTYSYNAVYLKYVVAGEGWVGLEHEAYDSIKKAAKGAGAVSGWDDRNHGGTGGVEVEFNLPLGTNKKFAKNLNKILPLASGRSVRCVKVSRDSQVADQANWNPPKWDALILAPEDE